jgi:hypothetical protein
MGIMWELFAVHPVLLVAQGAFTLWMFIDAYRRGVEQFWLWIILIFQPLGTWAYFLVVKLPSFRLPRSMSTKPIWQRRLSLDELRYRVDRTPTVMNRVALAERLMDTGAHAEAIPHLEAALALDETFCQALHDLAVCHVACEQADRALVVLDRLMKRDGRWADYRAWRTLIEAQDDLGRAEDALKTCRDLEKRVPTWENKCRLAERLIERGDREEAIQILDQALEDYHFAPFKTRLRHWRWARHAQQLLKEADQRR